MSLGFAFCRERAIEICNNYYRA
uniref:Uncharacterized protein n=1 Tax=Rhizophora mucronata TaxID=61149 RepID=A0A2P2JFP3_RHIMU